jgi:hypothetical protein
MVVSSPSMPETGLYQYPNRLRLRHTAAISSQRVNMREVGLAVDCYRAVATELLGDGED